MIIAWLLPRDVDDNFLSARRRLPARGDVVCASAHPDLGLQTHVLVAPAHRR
jgi:hypothetical protein